MNWLGYAGLALVAIALVAVLVGAAVSLPASLRLRRTALQTGRLVEMYRQTVELKMEEHEQLAAEREALLRPVVRVRRVVTHPLVAALLQSYMLRRRRSVARVAAP